MSIVHERRWRWIAAVVAALLAAPSPRGWAQEHTGSHCDPGTAPTPASATADRLPMRYTVPDVQLVRADGARVKFRQELEGGRPVVLNFIFTTCTAICPVMSQTLAKVQQRLGPDRERVRMLSVSIDPEQDTPERLAAYAKKFGAGAQWSFYTGTTEASIALQKAFDVYRGNKMNHSPVTFVRTAPDRPWIRLEGLGNADAIVREVTPALAVSDRRHP